MLRVSRRFRNNLKYFVVVASSLLELEPGHRSGPPEASSMRILRCDRVFPKILHAYQMRQL